MVAWRVDKFTFNQVIKKHTWGQDSSEGGYHEYGPVGSGSRGHDKMF